MSATMITSRAYQYASGQRDVSISPRSQSPTLIRSSYLEQDRMEKNGVIHITEEEKPRKARSGKLRKAPLVKAAHSVPSAPVIIPSRTTRHVSSTRMSRESSKDQHDPTALSPSMAALFAVTSISGTAAQPINGSHRTLLARTNARKSVSSSSPRSWSILQSPPSPSESGDEQDRDTDVEFDSASFTSQSTLADKFAVYRSFSTDSVTSLEGETHSYTSNGSSSSSSHTPASRRARSPRREKHKNLSTSKPLAEGELHPLATQQSTDDLPQERIPKKLPTVESHVQLDMSQTRRSSTQSKSSLQLKSNLTASLQKIKDAAKTSVLVVNGRLAHETRASEKRPKSPLPITNSAFSDKTLATQGFEEASDQPLAAQLYFSSTPGEEYRRIKSSIQLQEYVRRAPDEDPLVDRATAPPIFAMAAPPPPILLPGINSPRPREPRENSSFLRVVVLEMNMRRKGRLGNIPGRARIWLGPRPEKMQKIGGAAQARGKTSAASPRATKGMGEEVITELAEAMAVQESRDEQEGVDKDDGIRRPKIGTCRNALPERWVEWTTE